MGSHGSPVIQSFTLATITVVRIWYHVFLPIQINLDRLSYWHICISVSFGRQPFDIGPLRLTGSLSFASGLPELLDSP